MAKTIAFDEAGNTGQDLLNQDQKVFVLASVNFSDEEIQELNDVLQFKNELHFVRLKGSAQGREKIEKFINHKLIIEKNINVFNCHKRFSIVGQIVDQLIEPVFYKNGADLYKEGYNLIYSNYLYYINEVEWKDQNFDYVIFAFIQMMRKKDQISVDSFYLAVTEFSKNISEKYREVFFDPILESKNQIKSILKLSDKFSMDVTLSAFMVLSDLWYEKLEKKIDVIFDNSKQIEFYKEYIDYMRNMKIEQQKVGYGDKTMNFPAQINSIEMVDSKSSRLIQFSDVIASSIAFAYNNKNIKQQPFQEMIKESRLFNLSNFYTVWPRPNFSPEALGLNNSKGENILDFIANQKLKEEQ